MSVPSFQQLMLPALQTIGQRYDEISIAGLEEEVGKALRISPEERQVRLPSGNQTLFGNRLNWARSYLSKAGLIELPRRGYCRPPTAAGSYSPRALSRSTSDYWSVIRNSSPGEARARSPRWWRILAFGRTPRR